MLPRGSAAISPLLVNIIYRAFGEAVSRSQISLLAWRCVSRLFTDRSFYFYQSEGCIHFVVGSTSEGGCWVIHLFGYLSYSMRPSSDAVHLGPSLRRRCRVADLGALLPERRVGACEGYLGCRTVSHSWLCGRFWRHSGTSRTQFPIHLPKLPHYKRRPLRPDQKRGGHKNMSSSVRRKQGRTNTSRRVEKKKETRFFSPARWGNALARGFPCLIGREATACTEISIRVET